LFVWPVASQVCPVIPCFFKTHYAIYCTWKKLKQWNGKGSFVGWNYIRNKIQKVSVQSTDHIINSKLVYCICASRTSQNCYNLYMNCL
jgi:hypothetical protein